ncbi:MAG: hypothetical protein WD512_13830 [Candidatus Paceibacterota bacterium]
MKIKILLLISVALIQTFSVCGQKQTDLKNQLNSTQEQLILHEEKINELKKSNEELKAELKDKEDSFELYEILLNKYDNSRSSLIAEFSILITVLTLIFGFVGYFTALKPAQESKKEVDRLLEKLQSNIDDLFSDYLSKNRDNLIDKYLLALLDKKESEISNAIHYLDTVKHEGFNSEQLFKMRKIVLEDDYNQSTQIFTDMIFTKDEIVENTCVEIFNKKIDSLIAYALIYFSKHEIHQYDNLVVQYMNKNFDEWGSKIASIRSSSEDYLIVLWDGYFEQLNRESLSKIVSTLNYYKSELSLKDKTVADFIEKVRKSKFGQAKKEEELKSLFMVAKSLF